MLTEVIGFITLFAATSNRITHSNDDRHWSISVAFTSITHSTGKKLISVAFFFWRAGILAEIQRILRERISARKKNCPIMGKWKIRLNPVKTSLTSIQPRTPRFVEKVTWPGASREIFPPAPEVQARRHSMRIIVSKPSCNTSNYAFK